LRSQTSQQDDMERRLTVASKESVGGGGVFWQSRWFVYSRDRRSVEMLLNEINFIIFYADNFLAF